MTGHRLDLLPARWRPVRVEELVGHPSGILAVVTMSRWDVTDLRRLADVAAAAGTTVLPVRHDGAVTILGPLLGLVPGSTSVGCVDCAETGRLHAQQLPEFTQPLVFDGTFTPMTWIVTQAVAGAVAASLARDLAAVTATVWLVDGADATVAAHEVPPLPGCPACSEPEADQVPSPFVPAPRPVPASGPLRQPNELATAQRLRRHLVDPRFGPVLTVRTAPESLPVALVSAVTMIDGYREWGHGRAVTPDDAERIALFETVERRSAMRPVLPRATLCASFAELGADRAVDPVRLGLSDPRYHHHPASQVTPYRPDVPTRWVWGWSMTRAAATAVPENVAFYGLGSTRGAPRFVDETSNGNGLGNSLEEAVLHGLFEVIERDAFLMAWYARTPLTRVAVPHDELVWHLVDELDERGYELILLDATNDVGLPTAMALALCRTEDPTRPHVYFAAAAHHDPVAALRSAAQEAAVGVLTHAVAARPADEAGRERLQRMVTDPTEVRLLNDHVALYSLPGTRPRYEFLLGGEPVPWQELWPGRSRPTDLTVTLLELTDRLAALGMETVVVDQTDPRARDRLGLHTAKVLVPGSVPMAFGFVHQRTVGLPRLLTVPYELGRVPAVRRHDDLTLLPHPFG